MKAFLLLSLTALLSFVTMTFCNYMKEPVLCVPCSEWIMDMKMNAVKLRGKGHHECNPDTCMCYFAPHVSTSYISRAEHDKRNTADLEASESRPQRKRTLYEPPYVVVKMRAPKHKSIWVSKKATQKESHPAADAAAAGPALVLTRTDSYPSSRNNNDGAATAKDAMCNDCLWARKKYYV
jgi:hypothetical protein